MSSIPKIKITEDDFRQRADVIIAREVPDLSRSYIKKLAKEGRLLFNGKPISCGYKLRSDGDLVLNYDITQLQNIPVLELDIIYEDEKLIVVNKASGVITHSRGKYWDEPSVASSIRSRLRNAGSDMRAGIVHRLDRATSGVLLCAKDTTTAAFLQKQFEERTVTKTYYAVVPFSKLPPKGLIDKPLGRNPRKPSQFKVDPNGKPAQTSYEVVSSNDKYMLLELKPKTGRTHQLRVHLASLGLPIIGDSLYDGQQASRLMLHAAELEISYPNAKTRKVFQAPIPAEFKELTT